MFSYARNLALIADCEIRIGAWATKVFALSGTIDRRLLFVRLERQNDWVSLNPPSLMIGFQA
jgi:hypothetical protein